MDNDHSLTFNWLSHAPDVTGETENFVVVVVVVVVVAVVVVAVVAVVVVVAVVASFYCRKVWVTSAKFGQLSCIPVVCMTHEVQGMLTI